MKNESRAGDLLRSLVSSISASTGTASAAKEESPPKLPPKRFKRAYQHSAEFDVRREKIEARRERRGKMKAPAAIDGILKGALARFGLDKAVDRYRFVTEWAAVVGKDAAAATKPEYIKNHILYIRVRSSQWAQILSFRQSEILDRLEPLLANNESVSSVRFFVGEL